MVSQRTGEIGVRLALGATPASVVRLMMRAAGVALLVGVPAGLAGAAGASTLLRRFMFGFSPTDRRIYVAVALILVVVVLIAAWLPAKRAAAVNPTNCLAGGPPCRGTRERKEHRQRGPETLHDDSPTATVRDTSPAC